VVAPAARWSRSLDGDWDLVHVEVDGVDDDLDAVRRLPDGRWRTVAVPGPWQAAPGLAGRLGTVWYRRRFTMPPHRGEAATFLHLGAANHAVAVHLDGRMLARQRGGYVPVEVDLSEVVRPDTEHELLLRVSLPPYRPDGDEPGFDTILHGKQSWYGPSGGLWRSVVLERRPVTHVRALRVLEAAADGRLRAEVELSGPASGGKVELAIVAPDGRRVATTRMPAEGTRLRAELVVEGVRRWSPDDPALHQVTATLESADGDDLVAVTTGFRTFAAEDGRLLLNGRPVELRGVLDQDVWPDGGPTAPSRAAIVERLGTAKGAGFNLVRCHVKVPDPAYLDVADELGLLVWCELPHWENRTDHTDDEVRRTLAHMVERDGHHPSVVIWTVVNESWGVDVVTSQEDRDWVRDTARWLRQLDPTRPVVDNSPCLPNFHVESDLDDVHLYRAFPSRRASWDRALDGFAAGAAWTYSPHGDAVRSGDEPKVLSEFGAWGLPDLPEVEADLAEGTGEGWLGGAGERRGARRRAEQYGLLDVFGSADALVAATQESQFETLAYQIGSIRRRPELQGYVVTELTDAAWEANGLLDARGVPRRFLDRLPALNRPSVLVLELDRAGAWAGSHVEVRAWAVNATSAILEGELSWRLHRSDPSAPGAGSQAVVGAAGPVRVPPGVQPLPPLALEVPALTAAARLTITVEVAGAEGQPPLEGTVAFVAHPRHDGTPRAVTVTGDQPALLDRLEALGHRAVAGSPGAAEVHVVSRLDAGTIAAVRRGGRALVLAGDTGALGPNVPDALRPRLVEASDDADWVPTFDWLRRVGPFRVFPGGALLDASFERVIGRHVITGIRSPAFRARAYGGSFVGWVHNVGASVLQLPLGRGVAVITTYRPFGDDPGVDPVATRLTDALLGLTRGDLHGDRSDPSDGR
jgi:hypothetical protein